MVVFNDSALTLIGAKQERRQLPGNGVDFANELRAGGDRLWLHRFSKVERPEDLDPAFEAAFAADRAAVIDVVVNPASLSPPTRRVARLSYGIFADAGATEAASFMSSPRHTWGRARRPEGEGRNQDASGSDVRIGRPTEALLRPLRHLPMTGRRARCVHSGAAEEHDCLPGRLSRITALPPWNAFPLAICQLLTPHMASETAETIASSLPSKGFGEEA